LSTSVPESGARTAAAVLKFVMAHDLAARNLVVPSPLPGIRT
jgi:hypothetical protein